MAMTSRTDWKLVWRFEVHFEPRLGWFHIVHAHNVGPSGLVARKISESVMARVAFAGVQLHDGVVPFLRGRGVSSLEQLPWQEIRLEPGTSVLVVLDSVHEICGWWA